MCMLLLRQKSSGTVTGLLPKKIIHYNFMFAFNMTIKIQILHGPTLEFVTVIVNTLNQTEPAICFIVMRNLLFC
jgi:hypothetical protein